MPPATEASEEAVDADLDGGVRRFFAVVDGSRSVGGHDVLLPPPAPGWSKSSFAKLDPAEIASTTTSISGSLTTSKGSVVHSLGRRARPSRDLVNSARLSERSRYRSRP